jgi:hypothetical protein
LSAAQSFATSAQFRSPDGSYYEFWPPLFPVILSMSSHPIEMVQFLNLLITVLIGILLYRLAILFLKDDFLQFVFLLISLCSVYQIMISVFLWAELFFLFLVLIHFWIALFVEDGVKKSTFLIATAFLFCLQRSAGIFFVAGVSFWMLTRTNVPLAKRVKHVVSYFLISISGLVLWYWYVKSLNAEFSLSDFRFFEAPLYNLRAILFTLGKSVIIGPFYFVITFFTCIVICMLIVLKQARMNRNVQFLVCVIASYILPFVLLGRLDEYEMDRYFSVIIPFVYLLIVLSVDLLFLPFRKYRLIMFVLAALWVIYPMARTIRNTRMWHVRSCEMEVKNYFYMN